MGGEAKSNGQGAPALEGYGETLGRGERRPAVYAASAISSRGRSFEEPECATRSPFQRDRDRILHSTSFRRLAYKTQVFLPHDGDHYRTRLTHSLEVAQIARTIARQLQLDEDLAEAIALAHDLGHSPFGHAGERALDAAMRDFGGFDHNAQTLRVVTSLERKYMTFDGLNLTWETLEGLAKHNGPILDPAHAVAVVASRLGPHFSLDLESRPSAEAQVASLADDIAYLTHDIDDGLRAGLIAIEGLFDTPLAGSVARSVSDAAEKSSKGRIIYEITRRMITLMIADVVSESRQRLRRMAPGSPDEIRLANLDVVAFSADIAEGARKLKVFLFDAVYHHPRVLTVMRKAESVVRDLFELYNSDRGAPLFPAAWQEALASGDARQRARLACDYLAGETDRFALAEHRRLFDATPELR